jgi:hypothetical protein
MAKARSSVLRAKWSTAVPAFTRCSANQCGRRSAGTSIVDNTPYEVAKRRKEY